MANGANGEDKDELLKLLSPFTIEDLLARYWGREPLFIEGHKAKFAGLFDRSRFDALRRDPRAHLNCVLPHSGSSGMRIAPEQGDAMLAAGATLAFREVQALDGGVARLAAALKKQGMPRILLKT